MLSTFLIATIVSIIGYLSGSLSSAVIVCKLLKLPDPREHGSKNPGATNVVRVGGKKAGALVFLGDVLKALIPILTVKYFFGDNHFAIAGVGIGAFLGHLYPLFFGFKGGKGVATLVGVLLGIHWLVFLTFGIIWLVVLSSTKYVSLASIIAPFVAAVSAYFYHLSNIFIVAFVILAVLVAYRHKDNIVRVLNGTEPKIGKNKKS